MKILNRIVAIALIPALLATSVSSSEFPVPNSQRQEPTRNSQLETSNFLFTSQALIPRGVGAVYRNTFSILMTGALIVVLKTGLSAQTLEAPRFRPPTVERTVVQHPNRKKVEEFLNVFNKLLLDIYDRNADSLGRQRLEESTQEADQAARELPPEAAQLLEMLKQNTRSLDKGVPIDDSIMSVWQTFADRVLLPSKLYGFLVLVPDSHGYRFAAYIYTVRNRSDDVLYLGEPLNAALRGHLGASWSTPPPASPITTPRTFIFLSYVEAMWTARENLSGKPPGSYFEAVNPAKFPQTTTLFEWFNSWLRTRLDHPHGGKMSKKEFRQEMITSLLEKERLRQESDLHPVKPADRQRLGIPKNYLADPAVLDDLTQTVRSAVLADLAQLLCLKHPEAMLADLGRLFSLGSEDGRAAGPREYLEGRYLLNRLTRERGEPWMKGNADEIQEALERLANLDREAFNQRIRQIVHEDFPEYEALMPGSSPSSKPVSSKNADPAVLKSA